MPVDPWTALGAAGNIAQFVGYACKIVLTTKVVYKSGATETTTELTTIANEVERLSDAISLDNSKLYPPQLKNLAAQCKTLAADLVKALSRLRIEGKHSRWGSFSVALKDIWKQSEIADFVNRLHSFQNQLILGMQFLVT
jgi:hypothetical protein